MSTEQDNKLAVVEVLVGGDRPRKYWDDLKKKIVAEGYSEVSEKIGQLKMSAARQPPRSCTGTGIPKAWCR